MNVLEPFRSEDVLYRFILTQKEREYFDYEAPLEMLVVKAYPFVDWLSFNLFGRYQNEIVRLGSVENGPFSVLVGHLLRDRATLAEDRDGWIDTVKKFGLDRDKAEAALEHVERERDVYKHALERCTSSNNGAAISIVALETGKKLREQS